MNYLWSNINFPEKWILSVCQEIRISFFPSVVVTELSLCLYVGQTAWALKGRKRKSRGPKAEARSPGPQTSCWTIFLLELKMSRQSYFVFAKVCNVSPRLLSQYSPLSYFCFIILIFHWITKSFQLFPSTISCFSADFSMVENIILAGTHFMTQFGCFARGNHSSAWRTGRGGHGTVTLVDTVLVLMDWIQSVSCTHLKPHLEDIFHLSKFPLTQQAGSLFAANWKLYIIGKTSHVTFETHAFYLFCFFIGPR